MNTRLADRIREAFVRWCNYVSFFRCTYSTTPSCWWWVLVFDSTTKASLNISSLFQPVVQLGFGVG